MYNGLSKTEVYFSLRKTAPVVLGRCMCGGEGQGGHSVSQEDWTVYSSITISKNSLVIDTQLGEGVKSCQVLFGPSLGAGYIITAHAALVRTRSYGCTTNFKGD